MELNLYLYDIPDDTLDDIINMGDESLDVYIQALIEKFYGEVDSIEKIKLTNMYKASFTLEKIYRLYPEIHNNFTAIYTKTGLVRELVSDLYYIETDKLSVN